MAFADWVEATDVQVSTTYEFDQWYATAEDFTIVGVGTTEADAVDNMFEMVEAYLRSFYRDGSPYKRSLRPAGLGWKVRWLRKRILGRGHQRRLDFPFMG